MMEFVVRTQRGQSSHSDAVSEEDLSRAVDPGGTFSKSNTCIYKKATWLSTRAFHVVVNT